MIEIEEYKKFFITQDGRVWNSAHNRWQRLYVSEKGYVLTQLRGKQIRVHRLVAKAYIPNPENKAEVNHIDGNKQNNDVTNLEWATKSENMQHAVRTGLHKTGEEVPNAKLNEEIVDYIRKNYKARDKEFGGRALAKKFNVHKSTIEKVVLGKKWKQV